MPFTFAPEDDSAWVSLKSEWSIRPDTIYLNHGSFGPPPRPVRQARRTWLEAIESQPMDFFVRQLEPAWRAARERLARFVSVPPGDLIFAENATVGMNVVADLFPLAAGDEVLLTDHEYGAVQRIWQRACARVGARTQVARLPSPLTTIDAAVDAVFSLVRDQTRLIVVSHVTSPTAVTLPVKDICQRARDHGIAVAIDGPHAIAQLPLAIDALGCDFYAASCHKWLSAPCGSGFLYVAPRWQSLVRPPALSWGRLPPGTIDNWSDEFIWSGTRDVSPYLAIPAAIEFLESVGLDAFRRRTHWLARQARERLVNLTGLEPLVPDNDAWYTSMAHVPLPPPRKTVAASARPSDGCPISNPLQNTIWEACGIEVPIVEFGSSRYIRVSCHLYNDLEQIDRLVSGLSKLLEQGH